MKKIIVAAFVALMVLAPVSVFADEFTPGDQDGRGQRQRRGPVVQIISLTESELTFLGKDGEEVVIAISDEMKYLLVGEDGPEEADFSSFAVGDWVKLNLRRGEDDTPVLNGIVLLPEDFDAENRPQQDGSGPGEKNRGNGPMVQLLSISDSEITFEGKDGEIVTMLLTEEMRFVLAGEDGATEGSAADFAAGDWVKLNARRGDDDTPVLNGLVKLPEGFDPENRPEKPDGQGPKNHGGPGGHGGPQGPKP
jgi:hypothetical protein